MQFGRGRYMRNETTQTAKEGLVGLQNAAWTRCAAVIAVGVHLRLAVPQGIGEQGGEGVGQGVALQGRLLSLQTRRV